MKVRTGFVSNSSSSSFVVAFSAMPKDKWDVLRMMFPNGETTVTAYDDAVATASIADTVWNDMKDQTPMTAEEVAEEIASGWFAGQPNYDDYFVPWDRDNNLTPEEREAQWDAYHKASVEAASKLAMSFMGANAGSLFFKFSYGDEDGSYYATLEHGDIFSALGNVRISHH